MNNIFIPGISLYLLLFFNINLIGQTDQSNYACLNSTIITAQYLDRTMISKTVDDRTIWKGGGCESDWCKFQFEKKINITSIALSFYHNACLDKCELEYELIFEDTIIELDISQLLVSASINQQSNFLIIKRKNLYPRGPAHINGIKIWSDTKPSSIKKGNPKINLKKAYRLRVKYHDILGLSKKETKQVYKIWKNRKRFYKKNIKKHLRPYERKFFDQTVFYANSEKWYCYKVNFYLNKLTNQQLIELFDDCQCEVREEFFARKMHPTEAMIDRPFKFLGRSIAYSADSTESILVNYLNGGRAWAGHAIPHLCLMQKREYLDKIYSLINDKNTFIQLNAIGGLWYFNEHQKAEVLSDSIYHRELRSLQKNNQSKYGISAFIVLRNTNTYAPDRTLPKLLTLFEEYNRVCPSSKEIQNFWGSDPNEALRAEALVEILKSMENYIGKYSEK